MAIILTDQDLIDAKHDIDDIGKAVNEKVIVSPRYGDDFKSLPMIIEEFQDAIETAAVAGAGANGWTDLLIQTEDGSTQRAKNASLQSQINQKATAAYLDAELAEQTQTVNTALSQLSTLASKFYPTLAEANADIANIAVNQPVQVGESGANGGLWYKATAEAATLTKSAYDPLTQAKADATTKADLAEANAKSYTDLKVGGLYINESINLFDKDSVTAGFRPTYTADGLTAAVGQNASDFIAIQPHYQYVRNTTGGIWISFYDALKVFISGVYIATATSINTPENSAFMRLSVPDAQLSTAMITRGELSGGDYVPYESEKVAMSALSSAYVGNNFNTIKTNNLLDFSELEFTSYSVTDGTQTGTSLAPWILLPAKPAYFYSSNFLNSAFIFYDASMQFISALSSVQNAKAPPLAAFVRVRIGFSQTVSSARNAVVLEASHIADTFIPNETQQPTATSMYGFYKSQWYQKTWFVMGDSISTGNGIASTYASKPYHYLIAKEKRCKVHNIAVSGRTIAVASNADNLNQQVTNGKMPDTANAPDLITIFAGTNDFGFNIPIGTISDTDPATFYGGLNKLFTDIQSRFPYTKVGVITPLLRADRSLTNALGMTLLDYVNAIKLAAKKYEVPVLDLYNNGCGINFNSDAMTQIYTVNNDKIHPNDAGHKILAPKIAAFIESL